MNNYLVVGLGNIGTEYSNTRHNMGFMVLDAWAQASNIVFRTGRYGSIAELSFKGRRFTLLKPSTYMNLSGKAVRYWMSELKLPLENLIVISDDLNIPFGTIRMRKNGSAGGHNGLKSVIAALGTEEFPRIRLGVGEPPHEDYDTKDWVLGVPKGKDGQLLREAAEWAAEAAECYVTEGPERAMSKYNRKTR